MKIKVAAIFILLSLVFMAGAQCGSISQAKQFFYSANANYSSGDFAQAIENYENVLTAGFQGGNVYYNLGNAYFKSGAVGKAIVNYLRARRFTPRDPNLNSNLEYVRSRIRGEKISSSLAWYIEFLLSFANAFTLNGLTIWMSVSYFIFCLILIGIIVRKDYKKLLINSGVVVLILLIGGVLLFLAKRNQQVISNKAIVIVDTADAKFEPFHGATTFFNLYDGSQVTIIGSESDWYKIKRIDGKQGWVKKEEVEPVL